MKITWLGQAGLLFETNNTVILIDPYLSNSCEEANPNLKRRVAVDEKFLKIKPDLLILTHNHKDHADYKTLPHYINDKTSVKVFLSENSHDWVKKLGGGRNDYIILKEGIEWTFGNIHILCVKAYHSESTAIGVIITAEEKKYYITGDTLYNNNILNTLPNNLYAIFVPVNGFGNNMNITDAARFAKKSGAKYAVPVHFGMFDSINAHEFDVPNKIVPKIYCEIKFQ